MRRNLFREQERRWLIELGNRSNKPWNQPFAISLGWLWRLIPSPKVLNLRLSFPVGSLPPRNFLQGVLLPQREQPGGCVRPSHQRKEGSNRVLHFTRTPAKCPRVPITCCSRNPGLDRWTIEREKENKEPLIFTSSPLGKLWPRENQQPEAL